jgi:hypothetical protein
MKHEIHNKPSKRKGTKPIELTDIEFYKNKRGQLCVFFESVNHKYLDAELVSTSWFTIDSDKPFVLIHLSDEDSKASADLHLFPEKKSKTLNEIFEIALIREKWTHRIIFLKNDDFYPKNEH